MLPQYRGPSPVQNTIINLDDESGYTIIKMDKGIDTGDILFISEPISLRKNEKYLDLLNFLLSESSKGITQAIDNLVNTKFENNILIDTKTNKLKIIKIQFDGKKPIHALAYFGNFDLLKTKL